MVALARWCALALMLMVAACNQSAVDPGADVAVGGALQAQDGTAVPDARVALMKEPGAGDIFVGVLSIGLSCLEYEFSECGETRLTTTDQHGGFAYALKGADTQGRFNEAAILELTSALDRADDQLAGPGVSTRFQVQSEQVQIGLRVWEPTLTVDGSGRTVDVGFTDPPAGVFPADADLGDMRRWVVFQAGPDDVVWQTNSRKGGTSFDARVLEDSSGGVAAFATIGDILTEPEGGTDVEILLRSPRLAYSSAVGPPPSRARPCTVGPTQRDDCPLTDGSFADEFFAAVDDGPATQATIDLADEIDVTLVVVRGCSGTCTVEGSRDGSTWKKLGSSGEDVGPRDLAFKPKAAQVRLVRVTSSDGVETLREVSVWNDASPVSGSLLTAPSSVSSDLLPGSRPDGGRSNALLVAALVAALAVIFVLAVVLLTRGRRRPA